MVNEAPRTGAVSRPTLCITSDLNFKQSGGSADSYPAGASGWS